MTSINPHRYRVRDSHTRTIVYFDCLEKAVGYAEMWGINCAVDKCVKGVWQQIRHYAVK